MTLASTLDLFTKKKKDTSASIFSSAPSTGMPAPGEASPLYCRIRGWMQMWTHGWRGGSAHHMALFNGLNMRRASLLTENEAGNKVNTWSHKNPSGHLNWLPSLHIICRHQVQGKMKRALLAYFSHDCGVRMCMTHPRMEKAPLWAGLAFNSRADGDEIWWAE